MSGNLQHEICLEVIMLSSPLGYAAGESRTHAEYKAGQTEVFASLCIVSMTSADLQFHIYGMKLTYTSNFYII